MDNHTHKVTLYNDNENSYEYVMACLIGKCKHEVEQAEQCALLAHTNGSCDIKYGDFIEMLELKATFDNLNIKTEIKDYESNLY